MKDYAAMSDEQIAAMVAGLCTIEGVSINEDGIAVRNVVDDSPGSYSGGDYIEFDFDPCNNPADAWPIITANRIGVIPAPEHGVWRAAHRVIGEDSNPRHFTQHANPLRASMIVFLKMKEGEND